MSADMVQTLVARTLVDPTAPLGGDDMAPFDPATIEALRLFRGFITRIRHNGLRSIAPLTLRLLHASAIDTAFFAEIASDYLATRRAGPTPPPLLFAHLEARLLEHLPRLAPAAWPIVEGVLRHESRIWRMRTAEPAVHGDVGPALASSVAIEHYAFDLLRVCADLAARPHARLPEVVRGDRFLLYAVQDDGVRVHAVDPFTGCVLRGLDGHRRHDAVCRDVAAALGGGAESAVALLLADAAQRGFIVANT